MSLPELFANPFFTQLAEAATSSQITIVVQAAAPEALQKEGQFRILVGAAEYMLVTGGAAGNGKTWTVTRGVESTAVSHAQGEEVLHLVTAGSIGSQSDAPAGTPSLRSLGTGAQQAAPGTTKAEAETGAETVAKATSEAEVKVERERAEAAEALKAPLASPALTGTPTVPTAPAKTNTTQAASTAFVQTAKTEAEAAGGAVSSVFGRAGVVVAKSGDYTAAQVGADASGAAATAKAEAEAAATAKAKAAEEAATTAATSKVKAEEEARKTEVKTEKERAETAESGKLAKTENLKDLASAATARTNLGLGTAAVEAATAFDAAGKAAAAQAAAEAAAVAKVKVETERAEAAEALKAPIASPVLTGTPKAPTAAAKTNTEQLATTAFAQKTREEAETASDPAGTSAAGVKVEKERAEAAEALKAPLASPALTGVPTAPTAAAKTNTTQLATTAFVAGAKGEAESALSYAPAPSGDETGATDTAALKAAMPAKGAMLLRPGKYYVTELPTLGPEQALPTWGIGLTEIFHVGTGTCLRIHNASFPLTKGLPEFVGNMPGRIGPFIINGEKAGAGSVGVQIGDILCADLNGVMVGNYEGAGSINWLFKSEVGWCERMRLTNCHSVNGTQGVVFTNGGTGTGSFDYSSIEMAITATSGQDGIVMEKGVQFQGCHFRFTGNFNSGAGNTGTVWRIGSDNTSVNCAGTTCDFQFEVDGETGLGHKTINIGTTATWHGVGSLVFQNNASIGFQVGNVTPPTTAFTFSGYINVDTNLGKSQTGEGLNTLGGSTWARGIATVESGNLNLSVPSGDYFSATLSNGSRTLKLNKVYAGRARRILLFLTQPAGGEAGTVNWSSPGNNVAGEAQSIIWTQGGGAAPVLQTTNGAVDVVELVTTNGLTWYGTVLSSEVAKAEVKVEKERAEAAEALKAPLASPTLTGVPAVPTAAAKTNTTQIASTAFVQTAKGEAESVSDKLGAAATAQAAAEAASQPRNKYAELTKQKGVVTLSWNTASLFFIGVEGNFKPEVTKLPAYPVVGAVEYEVEAGKTATLEEVKVEGGTAEWVGPKPIFPTGAGEKGYFQFEWNPTKKTLLLFGEGGGSGLTKAEVETIVKAEVKTEKERAETAEALKAPIASPVLTGTPKAPTAAAKTNTEQLATTAFTQTVKTEAEAASDKSGAAATAQAAAEAAVNYKKLAELQPFPVELPENNGALGNGTLVVDAAIESTKKIVKSPSKGFALATVGQYIAIVAAGSEAKVEEKTPAEKKGYAEEHPQWNTLTARITKVTSSEELEIDTEAKHTVSNILAFFGSDDTVAIQEAINKAVTKAQETKGYCEVWFSNKTYCVAGELKTGGTTEGNAQITLPVIGSSGVEVKDGVTKAASKILTSATAKFKAYDVGAELRAAGKIKAGTTIAVVKSETEVEMSEVAEAEGSGITFLAIATQAQKQSMKITVNLKGTSESSGVPQWYQTVPQQSGAMLFSFGPREAGKENLAGVHAQPEFSTTNGRPAMIGGPTRQKGYEGLRFSNMMVSTQGLTLNSPSNTTMSGLDLQGIGCASVISMGHYALGVPGLIGEGTYANTLNEFVLPWAGYEKEFKAHTTAAVALGMPLHGNNDNSFIGNHSVEGHTCGVEIGEHCWHSSMRIVYGLMGFIPQSGHWYWSATMGYLSVEDVIYPCFVPITGGEFTLNIAMADIGGSEGRWVTFKTFVDEANLWRGIVYSGGHPTVLGGKQLKVIDMLYPPGSLLSGGNIAKLPAIPASKSFAENLLYRDAMVAIKAKETAVKVTVDGISEFKGKPVEGKPEVTGVKAIVGRNSNLNNLVKGAVLKGAGVEGLEVESYNSGTKVLTLKANATASAEVSIKATAPENLEIPAKGSQQVLVPSGAPISLTYTEEPTWNWTLL